MNNSLTVDASNSMASSTGAMVSPIRQYLAHRRLVRTLAYSNSIDEEPNRQKAVPKSTVTHGDSRLSLRRKSSAVNSSNFIPPPKISAEHVQEVLFLFLLLHIVISILEYPPATLRYAIYSAWFLATPYNAFAG